MAANMGALAESYGLRQGMKYRTPIREAMESVLAIDPSFLQGSPDRALGRWYFKVPGLFGGDDRKSEQYLRKALAYTRGHQGRAAALLGISRKSLWEKRRRFGID